MSNSLNHKSMIDVVNKRNSSYTLSLPNGDYYEWLPASNGFEDIRELSFRDIQYVHSTSSTFKKGYLYINNEDARKRLGLDIAKVKTLTMSRDEITKLLKGNMAQIKKLSELKDSREMMQEVIDVAKELRINNKTKLDYLSELSGVPVDLIYVENEDEE